MRKTEDTVVLVTGATDGIGRETALELARRGAQVIVHGRNPEKVEATRQAIAQETGNPQVHSVAFDLSAVDEIRRGAQEIRAHFPVLHVLLHNAGVFDNAHHTTEDGLERSFAVNHVAPFLLTRELLPLLERNAPARVITVSSIAHAKGKIHWDDLLDQSGYEAYAQSKLANILFTRALARRLDARKVTANALHPGVVGTKLLKAGFGIDGSDSLAQGAATSVFLALSPEVAGVTGGYFKDSKPYDPAPQAKDGTDSERLWEVTEQIIDAASSPALPGDA
jgi:NAD(P)-dependent dehydrogenase (short-subunit alcohol dehydrogenase family)